MNTEPDEYTLALQARGGDREALSELVERTRLRLFALAYAELRHYDDAQDAVAAALLQICRHVHELREPGRVREWMNSIVRNEVRRLLRARGATPLSLEEADGASDHGGLSLLALDIERALRQLPGDQARAGRMFYLEDVSIAEIARRLGRPEGTVKSWLHRGRQRLALEMEAYAPMAATPTTTPTPTQTAALIHTDLDAATVKKVTNALKTGGYRTKVLTPGSPGQLLETLKEYQAIVLDEWISGRSALEFLLNIKARPGLKELPLSLLCSDPEDFAVSAYYTAGVTRLVNKNNPDDLAKLAGPFEKPTTSIWNRFTERARRVVFFAQEEAARLGTNMVSSEHLLLGLVRETDTVAGRILGRLGVPAGRIRADLEAQVARGQGGLGQDMQLTADGKRTIDMAYEESQRLNHDYIGTEHLLLGLVRAESTLASRTLISLGADLDRTRREVDAILERGPATTPASPEIEGLTQRFTERARRAVFLSQEEAGRFGENFVGTEHLLLGLLGAPESVGAKLLVRLGISPASIRSEILQQATRGPGSIGQSPPLTPRAQRVIDLAWDEARELNHNYIGTEHMVLGLIREGDGLAARVLSGLGVTLERAQQEVRAMQSG
jgi:RNA polymerase sigma factor (sigma-70 family)